MRSTPFADDGAQPREHPRPARPKHRRSARSGPYERRAHPRSKRIASLRKRAVELVALLETALECLEYIAARVFLSAPIEIFAHGITQDRLKLTALAGSDLLKLLENF